MSPLRITAVICTYQRYDAIPLALDSLCRQTLPRENFELIVLDNSPAGPEAQALAERLQFSEWACLRPVWILDPGIGLSRARNASLEACKTPLIAYLDDDAIAEPEWLAAIVEEFSAHDALPGAVGGPVRPLWETPRPPWLPDRLLPYLSIVDYGKTARVLPSPYWLAGANVAFATEELRRAGGFRTDLGRQKQILISNEEIDVYNKLRAAGRQIVYTPDAVVHHSISTSRLTQSWFRRRLAAQAVSDMLIGAPADTAESQDALSCYFTLADSDPTAFDSLFLNHQDPALFYAECKAVYAAMRLLLEQE